MEVKFTQILGKLAAIEATTKQSLAQQREHINEATQRLNRLENCPCSVHRDPAHTCVILDLRDGLGDIKAEMKEDMRKIQVRLAIWSGVFATIILLLELGTRLLPFIWR